MADQTYAPKLPIILNSEETEYKYISDILENARQNIKMIVLTSPGEKLMDPLFGVGIRRYLFEPITGFVGLLQSGNSEDSRVVRDLKSEIVAKISSQVNMYNPEISIRSIDISTEENTLIIKLYYNYRGFINDTVEININA